LPLRATEQNELLRKILPFYLVPAQLFASRYVDAKSRCTNQETMMSVLFKRLLKDESGATAIEYGLIAAGISVAIIAVVQGLGSKLNTTFTSVQNALN
jgi:pilus assembly protein Flp/PilA